MINATGLHAAEIVSIHLKDIRPFETKVLNTLWGVSRPGRAKEIVFGLLCAGHRIAPSILIPYVRGTWLAKLCKARGPALITSQSIWEH